MERELLSADWNRCAIHGGWAEKRYRLSLIKKVARNLFIARPHK